MTRTSMRTPCFYPKRSFSTVRNLPTMSDCGNGRVILSTRNRSVAYADTWDALNSLGVVEAREPPALCVARRPSLCQWRPTHRHALPTTFPSCVLTRDRSCPQQDPQRYHQSLPRPTGPPSTVSFAIYALTITPMCMHGAPPHAMPFCPIIQ